jgi:hypothetical protein
LAEQALNGLNDQTRLSIDTFLSGAGNLPDWDVSFIRLAYHLEPDHLSPQVLTGCCPYARPESFIEKMDQAARRGWLQAKEGKFHMTFKGREVAQGITELSDRLFAKIEILPQPRMQRLLKLLDQVVAKTKVLPQPEKKPAFELSLRFEREPTAPILARIRRRTIDLLAFHDDAHLAARLPYETSGLLWETFTYVWRGDADKAPDLAAQLSYRNYTKDDYAAALEELAIRDWVSPVDERYVVQQHAAQIRQQVEENTDRLFAATFAALATTEMAELKQLMKSFANKMGAEG